MHSSRSTDATAPAGSVYEVPLNKAQAASVRDALAKAIYNNLFEWIVDRVNQSMKTPTPSNHIIGVLDIYGFEIFDTNSFEQLCINYVNEKLQQIFIQLTLKTEQEEYVREQIKWTPIQYFNNKVVCDLIEEKRPPGIFAALNDACATAHADPAAADSSFIQRLGGVSNTQFEPRGQKFLVRHYAGDVMYTVSGMTDKNKDALQKDLLDLIASSGNNFLQGLFPDRPDPSSKKRPPTFSDRIKASANALFDKLMRSQPSYIRTIKPNQNKSPTEYDTKAILHQIKYLGLQENIRVRRAGFAYRNTFEKIIERFYLLSPATSYAGEYIWQGDPRSGCERILQDTGIAREEWQMGVSKAFIKHPETVRRRRLACATGADIARHSCLRSRRCATSTGTTWRRASSARGATTCATATSARVGSSASGWARRRRSSMRRCATMATKSWAAAKSVVASRSSACASLSATTLAQATTRRRARCFAAPLASAWARASPSARGSSCSCPSSAGPASRARASSL